MGTSVIKEVTEGMLSHGCSLSVLGLSHNGLQKDQLASHACTPMSAATCPGTVQALPRRARGGQNNPESKEEGLRWVIGLRA